MLHGPRFWQIRSTFSLRATSSPFAIAASDQVSRSSGRAKKWKTQSSFSFFSRRSSSNGSHGGTRQTRRSRGISSSHEWSTPSESGSSAKVRGSGARTIGSYPNSRRYFATGAVHFAAEPAEGGKK